MVISLQKSVISMNKYLNFAIVFGFFMLCGLVQDGSKFVISIQSMPQLFILIVLILISNLSSAGWTAFKSRKNYSGFKKTHQWDDAQQETYNSYTGSQSNSSYRSSQESGSDNSYRRNDSDFGSNWSYSGSQSNSSYDYSYTSGEELRAAYSVLGISSTTSDADAKRAYLVLMKRYHPDRVKSLSESERIRAKEMSQKINAAWELVKKFRNI